MSVLLLLSRPTLAGFVVVEQTFSDLGTERDILLRSALDLLLGRHVCCNVMSAISNSYSSRLRCRIFRSSWAELSGGSGRKRSAKPDSCLRRVKEVQKVRLHLVYFNVALVAAHSASLAAEHLDSIALQQFRTRRVEHKYIEASRPS